MDLDGRLNLNAHGNNGQATQSTTNLSAPQLPGGGFTVITTPGPTDELSTSTYPASSPGLRLGLLFSRGASGMDRARSTCCRCSRIHPRALSITRSTTTCFPGQPFRRIPGRYAELGGTPDPGIAGQISPLAYNKWYDFSGNLLGPDLYGTAGRRLRLAARREGLRRPSGWMGPAAPCSLNMGGTITNSPYDMDLSRNAARGLSLTSSNGTSPPDDAFGVAELERLLRPFDRDSTGLPSRLFVLTGGTGTTPSVLQNKRDRSHRRNPGTILARRWRCRRRCATTLGYYPRHITDLLKAAQIPQSQWGSLVAPEMLAGLKLNLNRPLGVLLPPTTTGMSNRDVASELFAVCNVVGHDQSELERESSHVQLRPQRATTSTIPLRLGLCRFRPGSGWRGISSCSRCCCETAAPAPMSCP